MDDCLNVECKIIVRVKVFVATANYMSKKIVILSDI